MDEDRTVTVTCRRCGPVTVAPALMAVAGAGDGLFEFTCPRCARQVWQAADAGTLAVLRSVGVPEAPGAAPLELAERHVGAAISWDELLEAHRALTSHCCPQDELAV